MWWGLPCKWYIIKYNEWQTEETTDVTQHCFNFLPFFSNGVKIIILKGKLAILKLGLSPASVRIIDLNQTITLDNIDVTALESNHCPGAVMFLFKLPTGRRILHTGDFRACEEMEKISILREEPIEAVYLDTT